MLKKKNEQIFTYDRIFRLFMIKVFFYLFPSKLVSTFVLLQFYCSIIGDRHETKCASGNNSLAQRLKISLQFVFQS